MAQVQSTSGFPTGFMFRHAHDVRVGKQKNESVFIVTTVSK